MKELGSKKALAIVLQGLSGFERPKIREEQYMTDADVAADMIWAASMQGDIDGKIVADLGAGTGILGIGALLLGAAKVFFVEQDKDALEIAKANLRLLETEGFDVGETAFIVDKIEDFKEKVDTVIQNPPFGTKEKHADKEFLEKAFSIGMVVYTLHKSTTKGFVEAIAKDHDFKVAGFKEYDFPLKATYEHHKKKIERIKVGMWRLLK